MCCAEMDLFGVVKLTKSTQVAVGVRPLREGEVPILEATTGRLLEPAQEESSDVAQPGLNATLIEHWGVFVFILLPYLLLHL